MTKITESLPIKEEMDRVSCVLTPAQLKSLHEHLEELITQYRDKGSFELSALIPIIGDPPIIPQSLDTDAMLEAWNDSAKYGRKITYIYQYLTSEISGAGD